ncbi:MAG: hypothetical protein HC874_31910 [Richelia sp. SL_2_1]|nr:hypothetical protein [Richelia sp. SL_2_1]
MNHQIKLIKIHKRRLAILLEQQRKFQDNTPPHIVTEIEDIIRNIKEIDTELRRRLQELMLKSARYGINTPVEVTLEIEDIHNYFDGI